MSKIPVAAAHDLGEGQTRACKAAGQALLLARVEGRVYAVENRCPHLGMPLARGPLDGKVIKCPWHGSRFDVCTGQNLGWVDSIVGVPMPRWSHALLSAGRKPRELRTFAVSEGDGQICVELPDPHT